MKKWVAVVTLLISLGTSAVLAQGTVWFHNTTGARVTNSLTLAPVVAGLTFRVALYYLPDQAIAPTTQDFDIAGSVLGLPTGFVGVEGTPTGLFMGGTKTTPLTTPGGGFAWFQVRVWETAFGSSYEEAINNPNPINGRLACTGTSNIIRVMTGSMGPPGVPGDLVAYGLQGFYVCVPEPSILGLALSGLVITWLGVRRSQVRR